MPTTCTGAYYWPSATCNLHSAVSLCSYCWGILLSQMHLASSLVYAPDVSLMCISLSMFCLCLCLVLMWCVVYVIMCFFCMLLHVHVCFFSMLLCVLNAQCQPPWQCHWCTSWSYLYSCATKFVHNLSGQSCTIPDNRTQSRTIVHNRTQSRTQSKQTTADLL